jgi:hypothetical protein
MDFTCPVCLGSGKRLDLICGWCNGLGFERKISKKEMIEFIKNECSKNNIDLKIEEGAEVYCGDIECAAYFSIENKEIKIAKNTVHFFENLLHEFCHLRQYLWQTKAWKEAIVNGRDAADIIDMFVLNKKNISLEDFKTAIQKTIQLEWECENMVLEYLRHIKDYSEQRIESYKLNAYVYMRFYRGVEHFKKWHLPNKNYQKMGIHGQYVERLSCLPAYDAPITDQEIEIVKGCFE